MSDRPTEPLPSESLTDRLEGWKAIAGHLNGDVRTAKRWEVSEGLPVHRHQHRARSSVYAFAMELDQWRADRRPNSPDSASWLAKPRRVLMLAAMTAAVLMSGSGVFEPMGAAVQGAAAPLMQRAVWTFPDGGKTYGDISADGRYAAYVNLRPDAYFRPFRVRSLCHWRHDGSLPTLEEVIDFYDRGGRPNPGIDPEIRPLGLTFDEKRVLVSFLCRLSGTVSAGSGK